MKKDFLKALLDADIFIEAFANRQGFTDDSEAIWHLCRTKKIQGYITDIGLNKIQLICNKLKDNKASAKIESVLVEIVVIYPTDVSLMQKARFSSLKDFESATELVCAIEAGVDAVVTSNPQNFEGTSFPVLSVVDLLEQQEQADDDIDDNLQSKMMYFYFSNEKANQNKAQMRKWLIEWLKNTFPQNNKEETLSKDSSDEITQQLIHKLMINLSKQRKDCLELEYLLKKSLPKSHLKLSETENFGKYELDVDDSTINCCETRDVAKNKTRLASSFLGRYVMIAIVFTIFSGTTSFYLTSIKELSQNQQRLLESSQAILQIIREKVR